MLPNVNICLRGAGFREKHENGAKNFFCENIAFLTQVTVSQIKICKMVWKSKKVSVQSLDGIKSLPTVLGSLSEVLVTLRTGRPRFATKNAKFYENAVCFCKFQGGRFISRENYAPAA